MRKEAAGIVACVPPDVAKRPVTVVTDLVGQAIEVPTPPAFPDRNVRTETAYDAAGNATATDTPGPSPTATATAATPGAGPVTITYAYDPLGRLTAADYSMGDYFHYTYDAVGNRLTETTQSGTTTYAYDSANRLINAGGTTHAWDAKGNLLSDGVSTCTFDTANRLTGVTQGTDTYTFAYNGLGDRLRQTVNGTPTNYTLDLNAGLTQVLSDGTNTYLYGLGRIGEQQPGGWQYHLADALGSVRQLVDASNCFDKVKQGHPAQF